jgi:hypothetical protein
VKEDVDHIDWVNLPAQDHYDSWGANALSKSVLNITLPLLLPGR